MQEEPAKTIRNYNEFVGERAGLYPMCGVFGANRGEQLSPPWQEAIRTGIRLVIDKVDEILGRNNPLTGVALDLPDIVVSHDDPKDVDFAGSYSHAKNQITLVEGHISPSQPSRTKVFIHEILHFLSHNGRDDQEQIGDTQPMAARNNVGFRRNNGIDIREGREGQRTGHYFLAFNEAVTEQLAIDILPGPHETYHDYRSLLNQVIVDAAAMNLGSKGPDGVFKVWSQKQIKDYIYRCFFKGNLDGFTQLLQTTYKEYDISEQQFGLMTHKADLPSMVERQMIAVDPDGQPPSPARVAAAVQRRLDQKTDADYVTDIIDPDPDNDPDDYETQLGAEYDEFVETNDITPAATEYIGGVQYTLDTQGLIIYRGSEASDVLEEVTRVLDELLVKLETEEFDKHTVASYIDNLLFERYQISMLTTGFRDFYIYKHSRLDRF